MKMTILALSLVSSMAVGGGMEGMSGMYDNGVDMAYASNLQFHTMQAPWLTPDLGEDMERDLLWADHDQYMEHNAIRKISLAECADLYGYGEDD